MSTQLIKPNYLVILPPTQHHSFFRNLPPLHILRCWFRRMAKKCALIVTHVHSRVFPKRKSIDDWWSLRFWIPPAFWVWNLCFHYYSGVLWMELEWVHTTLEKVENATISTVILKICSRKPLALRNQMIVVIDSCFVFKIFSVHTNAHRRTGLV